MHESETRTIKIYHIKILYCYAFLLVLVPFFILIDVSLAFTCNALYLISVLPWNTRVTRASSLRRSSWVSAVFLIYIFVIFTETVPTCRRKWNFVSLSKFNIVLTSAFSPPTNDRTTTAHTQNERKKKKNLINKTEKCSETYKLFLFDGIKVSTREMNNSRNICWIWGAKDRQRFLAVTNLQNNKITKRFVCTLTCFFVIYFFIFFFALRFWLGLCM